VAQGLTLFGSWVYGLGEYEGVVRRAEKRAAFPERIVTRRFGGAEAEEAVRADDGGGGGKVVINRTC
jgi:threonine dehydrogenase-like Zn-dependent dehydrogenase